MHNDGTALRAGTNTLTWVGHASMVLQIDGKTIVCDPVWSKQLIGGFRRLTGTGLPLSAVPTPDAVLISHNHYDHLDLPTLWRLGLDTPLWVPLGLASFFRLRGFRQVQECGWWDSSRLGDVEITCVPAQHWSRRFAWDTNRSWWCGWVIEGSQRVYFAGDTAFFSGFQLIRNRFGALDVALLPIGAYDPPALLRAVHMSPEEAGAAWAILETKAMVPMHYGTFQLSDEPVGEPLVRMQRWWKKYGLAPERLWLPRIGETLRL
jgi:L-ascorbate metabolism protein UlaG (beta-lactamase superfamily)